MTTGLTNAQLGLCRDIVTFPTSAEVARVLKGKLEQKELSFKHKHPSRCVIFEEEFNMPKVGQEGTFYLQDQGGTLVLIGYLKKAGAEDSPEKEQDIPAELQKAYRAFVKAMRTGEAGTINRHCLPHSVSFTYEKRENPAYGNDINTHFAKTGFDGTVFLVRKDGEGCYLVRTNTTALWFIETKSMSWKLYEYLDKLIQ